MIGSLASKLEALERLKAGPLSTDFADFPEKYNNESSAVLEGLRHQWFIGVSMRRYLRDNVQQEDRQNFLAKLSLYIGGAVTRLERLGNEATPADQRELSDLQTLHHLTIKADQAELCAQAF